MPSGPYLHGSRHRYELGDLLHTDIVNGGEGEDEDLRLMCFATTSIGWALAWAYQRSEHRGPILYVFEVAIPEPEVDLNVHMLGSREQLTSVMGPRGVVVGLTLELPASEYVRDHWPTDA